MIVARLEGWPLGAALHVVSDALMNNGSGKHHVSRPATRVVLVFVCLVGFFVLIEFLQQLLPSAIGWDKQWQMKPRSAADASHEAGRHHSLAEVQKRRVWRVFGAWLALMGTMSMAYFHDHLATDEEGRAEYYHQGHWDRLSASVLYAVSTGCSGGFGHLSSDWVGSMFILASVPLTAWLGGEVSMYRKALRDAHGSRGTQPTSADGSRDG